MSDLGILAPRPLVLTLTDDEAGVLIHMLGADMVGLMRHDANDPRVPMLSDLVVRLQLAREALSRVGGGYDGPAEPITREGHPGLDTDHPIYDAARLYYRKDRK